MYNLSALDNQFNCFICDCFDFARYPQLVLLELLRVVSVGGRLYILPENEEQRGWIASLLNECGIFYESFEKCNIICVLKETEQRSDIYVRFNQETN
jgi:ubiquinone/menaquinone biosynthesis C-methylase UbiE